MNTHYVIEALLVGVIIFQALYIRKIHKKIRELDRVVQE